MSLHPELQVGVVFPQTELAGDLAAVRAIGDAAESLGFDHLVAYDHVLGADHADRDPKLWGPYDVDDTFHDPFTLFAYLAGRTERLGFATGILILPQRQTALVARQAADVAILTEGRFRLGVGVGWNHVEYTSLGQDFSTRGRRADEQLEVLRRLWREETIDFDGDFDRIPRAGIPPRPPTPPPVWIGGFGPAAFRRCIRAGDGFFFGGPTDAVREGWTTLQEMATDAGRDPSTIGAEAMILTRKGPADAARKIDDWATVGGTHASVITMGLDFDSPQAHVDYLGQVADALS